MEKFSQEWWRSIPCKLGCANCCPINCTHLTAEKLCDVHPSLFGGSNFIAHDNGRGLLCHTLPIDLFECGYYCLAITDIMEEQGIMIRHSTGKNGIERIDNLQEIIAKTIKLRGY